VLTGRDEVLRNSSRTENYRQIQLRAQLAFLKISGGFSDAAKGANGKLYGIAREFVLPPECKQENLFEKIRTDVAEYFKSQHIAWHTARSHLLSSQICCLNFLAPFSSEPHALKALLQGVVGPIDEMLETETGRFVSFEFTGGQDYLNEWKNGVHTRGSNCTSVDAMVRFRSPDGRDEAALIEWKYTERYGRPRINDPKREERLRRYRKITFFPEGPIRGDVGIDIGDLFAEPIFQLYRQQMLASRMLANKELGLARVRTVLIAPRSNIDLFKMKVPALGRFGTDILTVFRAILHDPNGFIFCTTEDLWEHAREVVREVPSFEPWYRYIAHRYCFA
jgi:hypothetical protein